MATPGWSASPRSAALCTGDLDCKYALQRHAAPLHRDVGSRKAERTAKAVAAAHPTAHAVGTAQQSLRGRKIGACQGISDPATGDAHIPEQHRRDDIYLKTELRGLLSAPLGARLTAAPEAKIMTDHHRARARGREQRHEIAPRQHAQPLIEAQQTQPIDPACGEQPQALAKVGQSCRWIRRLQEFARQRLEAHHHGGQAEPPPMLPHALDQRAVAEMDSIKAADRDDAFARCALEPTDELHEFAVEVREADQACRRCQKV